MNTPSSVKPGSDSQDSEGMVPPGVSPADFDKSTVNTANVVKPQKLLPSLKGVENAKKRLRAFSIQKKTPIAPIKVTKAAGTGTATVLIGKLSGAKIPPKVEPVDPEKKPPKPPKPGNNRKALQDSYSDLQKRTLSEIEDMKRKMELVELGIPLGLICPAPNSDKAMPTKAMPPIKSFLDPSKVDDLIREAKKARAEGREYKFDYQKLLPDYDNPFQRKKDEGTHMDKHSEDTEKKQSDREKDKRKSDKYDKRHLDYRRDDRDRHKDDRRYREKTEKKDRDIQEREKTLKIDKEAEVNLNDYLVCDSWSLDNDDTKNSASPRVDEKMLKSIPMPKDKPKSATDYIPEKYLKQEDKVEIPKTQPKKIEKLQPVMDSFKFEIDPNEDEMLDIFDEDSSIEKYASKTLAKRDVYDSPMDKMYDYSQSSKDTSIDDATDDTFLESVINEINKEMDGDSHEKGLVEYDLSPPKKSLKKKDIRESVTPEMDDRMRDYASSQRSDYSDGYRSMESGYKSTESGCKTDGGRSDSFRLSVDKEVEVAKANMSKSTVSSLETWNFVLKICQPLLFRHDKNKCYRETHSQPKVWYTENPRLCSCVKDRAVVYEELEMCKMNLVDHVYGCDQIEDTYSPTCRTWYPRLNQWLSPYTNALTAFNEWEADESQTEAPAQSTRLPRRSATPQRNDEVCLDREYQRFMQAVWPEVVDVKPASRSTTPVRQEARKKKAQEPSEEESKKMKKIKLSLSEGWSQESEVEEEVEKSKKLRADKVKPRKRRHSSTSLSDSDDDSKSKKKSFKKKESKKTKSKIVKRQRLSKKYLKKLKEKQKKNKKKLLKVDMDKKESEDGGSSEEQRKKDKKAKKKKQKQKKKAQKKRRKSSSSSDSSSSSTTSSESTETDSEPEKKHKKKSKSDVKKKNKKKRQQSSSESQSEELFDVNILKNIKKERLTDDEKNQKLDFSTSPRRKPREIINVKELQNDFVGNNLHVKKEAEGNNVASKKVEEIQLTSNTELQLTVEKADEIVEEEEDKKPDTTEEILEQEAVEQQAEVDTMFKEPMEPQERATPQLRPAVTEESNLSQCSSQESVSSKEQVYEKDDSHLRPSSQNSNYSFNDVIASQGLYQKGSDEDKFADSYEQGNYEIYEQLAMAYQSDVANQAVSPPGAGAGQCRPIETVVRAHAHHRGEIKCDWRAGESPAATVLPQRPSRWGLKPSEVNIVLTGGVSPPCPAPAAPAPAAAPAPTVYRIQSLANRTDNSSSGSVSPTAYKMRYDEAYLDMYGAADRLQYGDCFATDEATAADTRPHANTTIQTSSLDARIDQALKNSVLREVAAHADDNEGDTEHPEKGILITKSLVVPEAGKEPKRVSFADGYKPGQDSDVEEPPKKKKKSRRLGCAWPCPATHPDHVPLWDALPPPPPPPGSPPPAPHLPPHLPRPLPNPLAAHLPGALPGQLPTSLTQLPNPLASLPGFPGPAMSLPGVGPLRPAVGKQPMMPNQPPHHMKFDPSTSLSGFMPPEPPPGLITFS